MIHRTRIAAILVVLVAPEPPMALTAALFAAIFPPVLATIEAVLAGDDGVDSHQPLFPGTIEHRAILTPY
jgi:hypothetical protein